MSLHCFFLYRPKRREIFMLAGLYLSPGDIACTKYPARWSKQAERSSRLVRPGTRCYII